LKATSQACLRFFRDFLVMKLNDFDAISYLNV